MGMEADTQLQGTWGLTVLLLFLTLNGITCAGSGSRPVFKRTPLPELTALVNDTIRLPCKARGDPKPFIVWYYKGESISTETNERFKIKRSFLEISNLQISDSGQFACKAENEFGFIWGNVTLKVINSENDLITEPDIDDFEAIKQKPKWSHRKDDTKYLVRPATQSVKMNCDVRGYPTPTITWFHDGKQVKSVGEKFVMQRWSLTINDLAMVDKGEYTCVVANELGKISWTYTLDVNQRLPVAPIIEGPVNQTVVRGDDATFECKILMSTSQPLLQWLKHKEINGSYVNADGEPYVDILQQSGWKKSIDDPQFLVLHNVTKKDEGWYTCLLANSVGMNYVSAWLSVVNDTGPVNNSTNATAMVGATHIPDNSAHNHTFMHLFKNNTGVTSQPDRQEPHCYSRFDYEYKVLQRLIQLEEADKWIEEKIAARENENKELKNEVQRLNEVVSTMSNNIQTNGGLKDRTVAFTAYIDNTTTLSSKTVFNRVVLNEGRAYNPSTGVFTCPIAGIYMFSIVVAVRGHATTWAEIRVNGNPTLHAIAEGNQNSQDLQGTNLAVVKLNKGDTVWIYGSGTLPANSNGDGNKRTSSFSGFLVQTSE